MSAKALMLFLPCFLVGCVSLDPHYDRPAGAVSNKMPAGDAYKTLQDTSTNYYRSLAWRDYILNDQLRQVVAMSLNSSRDLREAVASVKAAHAQYGEERSYLFPTVTAGLSGTRSRALTGEGNQTALSNSYSAEGSMSSFELDLFGKNQSLTREQYETYLVRYSGRRPQYTTDGVI